MAPSGAARDRGWWSAVSAMERPGRAAAGIEVGERLCECCQLRPAVTRVLLPGDVALLCGGCADDARALGLLSGGAA